jgi:hypothetical protein
VSICSGLVVAQLLKPDDYGLMALAGTWIAIASLIAELGLSAAIIQFPDLEDSDTAWLSADVARPGRAGSHPPGRARHSVGVAREPG